MQHHIHLDLELVLASRWHAGSGEGSLTTDRLVRRDPCGRPFIPASTMKGIIRHSCEKLARALGFPDSSDPHQSDLKENRSFVAFEQMRSPIDRLFGTKYETGGLFFRNAHMATDRKMTTTVRNRVARYRVLQTAKDKHLFSTEYAPPEVFNTVIDGWHRGLVALGEDYPPYAYCLLVAGILAVERVGADKSTGAGWLDGAIGIRSAMVNGSPLDLEDIFEFLEPEDYTDIRQDMRGAR